MWIVIKPCCSNSFEKALSEELKWSEEEVICHLRKKKLYVTNAFLDAEIGPNSYIQFEQKAGEMVICEYLFVKRIINSFPKLFQCSFLQWAQMSIIKLQMKM